MSNRKGLTCNSKIHFLVQFRLFCPQCLCGAARHLPVLTAKKVMLQTTNRWRLCFITSVQVGVLGGGSTLLVAQLSWISPILLSTENTFTSGAQPEVKSKLAISSYSDRSYNFGSTVPMHASRSILNVSSQFC